MKIKEKLKEISEVAEVFGTLFEKPKVKIEIPKFNFTLVVKSPFRNYQPGQHIVDPVEIEKIMACSEKSMTLKSANTN